MSKNTQPLDGHWCRFGSGMLSSLLIVVAWSALCWSLRSGYTGPFRLELLDIGIFNIYILGMLAQIVVCLLLARRKTPWWSAGAVAGTLLSVAGPVALALMAAGGMPATHY